MKINYPLIFEMTSCQDCKCKIWREDKGEYRCFLDEGDRTRDDSNDIPEDCPARQHEDIDVNLILNNIVKEIKDKFKCKVRWEYYPEDDGQYFIKVSDEEIYDNVEFQSYIWDVVEQNSNKINLNYCYEE
jgi:hypothetical protein